MVMAKLHTICGNCGYLVENQTVEVNYDPKEDLYDVSLKCPDCATLHFFEVKVDEDKNVLSKHNFEETRKEIMKKEIKASDVYPITTIRYPDGRESVVVLRRHLKDYTPPVKYASLMKHLTGQTATLNGVYVGDVEDWLNKRPNLD